MGYPEDLKVVHRKLADKIVISSSAFTVNKKFNFGARMALFEYNGSILVWSALPFCEEVTKSLQLLTGRTHGFNVTHLIIPNTLHTMGAPSFKREFPGLKIFASEEVDNAGVLIDYAFTEGHADRIVGSPELQQKFGIASSLILDNFEFVYLPKHSNRELVVFDRTSKCLLVSDLLINLGIPGTTSGEVTLEQYSPETGFEKGFNPHGGFSFLTRYLQPHSIVGRFIGGILSGGASSATALQLIHSWDFDTIVMSHGNVIDTNAREEFAAAFSKYIKVQAKL